MALSVEIRDLKEKNKDLRKTGIIPGILYGGEKNSPIKVSLKDFMNTIHEYGMSKVIDIDLDGKIYHSIIKDYQLDVLTDEFTHFDLLEVSKNREIKIPVPVHLEGNAQGVHEGGVLEILLDSILISGVMKNIPAEFKIDISSLKIGDSIHVHDLNIPKDCKVLGDMEAVIVLIASPENTSSEDESVEN